jgi:lambda family phage tail tape measure protein
MADQNIQIQISALDQTRAAFTSVQRGLSKLQSGMQALGVIASAQMFAGFIKGQIDAQDQLFKMSQKVGIATDELSKLQYAAKLSDVDTQALQGGLVKLSKGMSEAAMKTGSAYNAFQAMGLSVRNADGSLKSSGQMLAEVADKFTGYEDSAEKAALAVAIFGRSGADLIPLLNQGATGLKEAGDEAYRFGAVVMPEAAKQAEIFNDNMSRLGTVIGGVGKSIANELLTPINRAIGLIFAINKVAAERGMGFWDFLKPPTKETASAFLEVEKEWKKYQGVTEEVSKAVTKAPVLVNAARIDAGREALEKLVYTTQLQLDKQTRANQLQMSIVNMTDAQKDAIQRLVDIYDLQVEKEREINQLLDDGKITKKDAENGLIAIAKASDEARTATEGLLVAQENVNASWQSGATAALQKYVNEATNMAKQIDGAVTNAFKSMEDAILSFVMTGKFNFKSLVNSILSDLMRIVIQRSITAPLASALASAIPQLAGARASGGTVSGGSPYLVGERGAEIFVPNQTGTIIPNDKLGMGGGVVINQVLNVDASADKASIARALEANKNQTIATISDMMRRNNPAIPR